MSKEEQILCTCGEWNTVNMEEAEKCNGTPCCICGKWITMEDIDDYLYRCRSYDEDWL
jgi:hypothetical protein